MAERYITDAAGGRTAVVLGVEEHEALLRAAEDASDERIHDEAVAGMRARPLGVERANAGARPLEEVAGEIERAEETEAKRTAEAHTEEQT